MDDGRTMKLTSRKQSSKPDPVGVIADVESQNHSYHSGGSPRRLAKSPERAQGRTSQSSSGTSSLCVVIKTSLSPGFIVTILKDIIAGTILGSIFLLFLVFLDYSNVIQLSSARALRNAAFRMMNDPEMVHSLENTLDVKFIPMETYERLNSEIFKNLKLVADGKASLEEGFSGGMENLEAIKKELDDLMVKGNALLELDKFCDECKWRKSGTTCAGRVQYLKDSYKDSTIKAKAAILKEGDCKKSE